MLNGMKLVAWPFLTKLKTVLSIAFVTKCAAIMVLIVYGLTHQGFINNLQRIKPVPKAPPGILYSDYFAPDIVKKNASIVIIVLSAIEKYQRREAVRNSWLKDCKKHTQVVCLFMMDTLAMKQDNTRIRQEINTFQDIVISPVNKGMLFGHRVLFSMQWAVHHYNFDYLIRSDDDVLICIEHLLYRSRYLPRRNFMSGVLHCADEGMVYLDEGMVTFSQDLVRTFLSQSPDRMYCHTYGDQTYSTWVKDMDLSADRLYHVETRIHHHPPASRVQGFSNRTKICNDYVAVHGLYGNDMARLWRRRGSRKQFSNETGLKTVQEMCSYEPTYDWRKFTGIYGFEPKLCSDANVWAGIGGKLLSREHWPHH